MISIFLFIGISFFFTFIIGRVLERFRVPWIFGALILGLILAINNPFGTITSSNTFSFLAQLGMYLLLFIIGFELDLKRLKKLSNFIFSSTFLIIFLEGIVGSLLIHFVFHYSMAVSFFVALSFATVGEAILIPILDEFGLVNTTLGQTIIGIGTLDDIIEIALLIGLSFLIDTQGESNILIIFVSLGLLVVLTWFFRKFKFSEKLHIRSGAIFFAATLVLFIFLGIGEYAGAEAFGAILAGVSIRGFLPKHLFEAVELPMKSLTYGLFAPLFFLWVGSAIDMSYLFSYPLLVLLVVVVSNASKLVGSFLVGRKKLGAKNSVLLGIGLSVRFSTSIIIIRILFQNAVIGVGLYSVVLASNIVFEFVVPIVFSNLVTRWKMEEIK